MSFFEGLSVFWFTLGIWLGSAILFLVTGHLELPLFETFIMWLVHIKAFQE